ncbi:MAG: D-alanyl-D-alanine carboxypeptidase/D-alanyl-D-alanine-endopeptidase [Planctomycetes bacterium]|nr:D-alanyl-D-alanine carboxypeptidase/D-alanyl-D-alanine-endopeptidase [Planctomycetota bacterium]
MSRCSRALSSALCWACLFGASLGRAQTTESGTASPSLSSPSSAISGEAKLTAPATVGAAASSVAATSSASDAIDTAALAKAVEAVIDVPEFKHSHWGVLVVDPESCRTLYDRNGDKLFAPASVTKLFSVAAALDEFGADHRFETPVYRRGDVDEDGILDGDLILVAAGDPNLGGRADGPDKLKFRDTDHTYAGFSNNAELVDADPLAGLDALAKQIHEAGIREVRGDVLIDDRLFTQAVGTGSGPSKLTPIVVNDNVLDFTITPGEVGKSATIDWRPKTAVYMIDAQVQTVAAGTKSSIVIDEPLSGTVNVRGTIAADKKPTVMVHEAESPASFARSLFIEALRRAGVRVEASPLTSNDPSKLPKPSAVEMLERVAVLESAPFAAEAKLILKVSHNQHASMLPLLIAAKHDKKTLAEGLHLEREALARFGVGVDTISFGGAAGGDRGDYVTPRAAVELLCAMARRDDFDVYREALPILGEDGTLAAAVSKESPARGKVRAKTGTLAWSNTLNERPLLQSKALAGYAETRSGRTVVFAFFVNLVHLREPGDRDRIGRVLGTLCEKLHETL